MTDVPNLDPYSRLGIQALVQRLKQTNDQSCGVACGQLLNRVAGLDIGGRVEDDIRKDTASILLRLLTYEVMLNRHSDIQSPSGKTFDWVFEEQPEKYDSLPDWLSSESGLYWISGKEASGKSTMMKYIRNHDQTELYLSTWAQSTPLATAAFFSWRSGSPLEKSQEGLLRSLLYTVLSQHSYLLPLVLPQEWATIYCRVSGNNLSTPEIGVWDLVNLRRAFTKLINQDQYPLKLFFLVDGLDEYEDGDTSEILRLFTEIISSSANAKALVSSRPEECPLDGEVKKLVLHNLTQDDIQAYISEHLESSKDFQYVKQLRPDIAQGIISFLIDRSGGLFLWVVLAVRTIRQILVSRPYRMPMLQDLEDELPPALEILYQRLWTRIPASHKPQASRVLQIILTSRSIRKTFAVGTDDVEPLTLADLAFGDGLPYETILLEVSPWDEGRILSHCNQIAVGFTRHWPGFIEISGHENVAPIPVPSSQIRYCHRSTMEFLSRGEIQTLLKEATESSGFCPYLAHLKSAVHRLKILPHPLPPTALVYMWDFVSLALISAGLVESQGTTSKDYQDLMTELDKTMTRHHENLQKHQDGRWIERSLQDFNGTIERGDGGRQSRRLASLHWSSFPPDNTGQPSQNKRQHLKRCKDSFLGLAIQFGLGKYLESQLAKDPNLVKNKEGRPLLSCVLDPLSISKYELISPEIVKILLDHGADPEVRFEGRTCWEDALRWQYEVFTVQQGRRTWSSKEAREVAESRVDIFIHLIRHGVNSKAVVNTSTGKLAAEKILTDSFKPWVSEPCFEKLMEAFREHQSKA